MLPVTTMNFDDQIDTLTCHNLMVLIVDKTDQLGPHSQNFFFVTYDLNGRVQLSYLVSLISGIDLD
jgi:hypothetical protein